MEKPPHKIEDQERRETDVIMNQYETQKGLINNGGKDLFHKQIFKKAVKEEFNKIIKLTDEANFYDLIYCF